jgi:small subunit ribosomal protein S6
MTTDATPLSGRAPGAVPARGVAQKLKTKQYETIYILRPDVDADTADKVQGRVAEVLDREKGKLLKVEAWGRRRLAYPVAKQKKGVYVYVKYVGKGGLVQEVERNLKLQDAVLKFQTVLLEEEVDVAGITVDPEDIKFHRLELPPEAEEAESREKALGLIDLGPDAPRGMSRGERGEEDEFADEEAEEEPKSEKAAAAAPAPEPTPEKGGTES